MCPTKSAFSRSACPLVCPWLHFFGPASPLGSASCVFQSDLLVDEAPRGPGSPREVCLWGGRGAWLAAAWPCGPQSKWTDTPSPARPWAWLWGVGPSRPHCLQIPRAVGGGGQGPGEPAAVVSAVPVRIRVCLSLSRLLLCVWLLLHRPRPTRGTAVWDLAAEGRLATPALSPPPCPLQTRPCPPAVGCSVHLGPRAP